MRALTFCRAALLVVLASFAAGCSVSMQLPKDFLELRDGDELQAVTGDDARLWARVFEVDHAASLAFWSEAVEHDFVHQRGYEVVGRGAIEGKRSAAGVWWECAANVRGERIGYLLALWVAGDEVRVVEFAARAEVFAARLDAVKQALPSVRW